MFLFALSCSIEHMLVQEAGFLGSGLSLLRMNNGLSWERKILSNGLVVLLCPLLSRRTSQLSIAVKYGSNDDSEEASGTAHFLEHMLVGGSQERIKLHHEIEELGGCSHFETAPDCIFSSMDVLSGRLVEASRVLSKLLFDPTFVEEKLEIERKVILNEIDEAADDPQDKVEEALIKCLFKHHPVRNPTLGTKKTVNKLTLIDVEKSHQDYFVPKNMALIITGNFSGKEAETVIEHFQDRENHGSIHRNCVEAEESRPKGEMVIKRSGISQAYLNIGLRTVPAKNPYVPALNLIDSILGMGESSRLFVELREKRALTYDFQAINISGLDYGYFTINGAVKTKALRQTQDIIHGELEKIKNHPVPKPELEKSKSMLIGDIYRAIDDSHALPRIIAEHEIYFENTSSLQNYVNAIARLSEKDITETAYKYFNEENYATAVVTPKK